MIRNMIIRDFGEKYIDQSTGDIIWRYLFIDRKWSLEEINKYRSFFDFKLFLLYQSLSSEMILYLEPIIDETNSWNIIIKRQILSPDIIMRCKSKINFSIDFIKNQHWEPWMICSLSNDELNRVGGINSFSVYQLLPEEFILENKNKISIDNILKHQRITPRLISELKINKNSPSIKYSLRENIFYNTDIGKDWFIVYVCITYRLKRRNFYYPIFPSRRLLNYKSDFYGGLNKIVKARVFYKDLITLTNIKKVDIIREYDENNKINFYKR